ncbi:bifunctional UDP-N-acetylglucosamine diphosphorylase/glucosamine-1-phosphate N-acetyltransferase GlmU [Desulfurobacterium atlanticum]|uniref:Bifunctional protein GlmU n=1 Tax=Desulfurobacterium atlanticum TaxID=240169 RepID=A0A238YUL7_9BACT|nr:bifunctional UDP-N-acetylglucosamine diphosphorylase/glucosamine-1-phosphate N-acetyltransferase GlmU [Desulfurobacterium atlanticum]SNR74642.1 UDP-N-acetylglucosamine pyrophosphorylase /glucosamine-1-phosphate N-acetyltransferase [Desulfurobacterium atlanticum]
MGFRIIILAAGKGTRFKSDLPKVLHKILGKPMLWYVIKAAEKAEAEEIVVVVGHKKEMVEEFIKKEGFKNVKTVVQEKQLGTGHAVSCAEHLFENYDGKIIVLNGDSPLIKSEDIKKLSEIDSDMVVLTGETDNPTGYGRVVRDGDEVLKIVEEKDATEEEKKIKEVNSGIYAFSSELLFEALKEIDNNNAQKEYYLPDVLKIFKSKGLKVKAVKTNDFDSIMGVNNRYELSKAEELLKRKLIKELQLSGVTVHNPESCYIEPEVTIGKDTEIFAPVYIKGKTVIGENCTIGAFTEIVDSVIESGATIKSHSHIEKAHIKGAAGPFSRIREGTVIEENSRVGSFVETKKAILKKGAKANHLTYLGDCIVGENTNVGAGTITCNYDGFNKWRTEIGKNVFVGSNTLFIAPVKVGNNAITAAGSVITKNVPENALAIARSKQINLEGKAETIREKNKRLKDEHFKKDS